MSQNYQEEFSEGEQEVRCPAFCEGNYRQFQVQPDYSGYYCDQEQVNVCTVVPYPKCRHTFSHFDGPKNSNYKSLQEQNFIRRTPNVKRYPITVGTPKYYRKQPASGAVLKKPSALCLPLATQPDPAVKNKLKNKELNSNIQSPPDEIPPRPMDSEGDMPDVSEMIAMLDIENVSLPKRSDIAKIAKFLKPKMPASIRAKQQGKDEEKEDALEKLLMQLQKCELENNNDNNNNNDNKKKIDKVKSFNYSDINTKLKHGASNESVNKFHSSTPSVISSGKPRCHPILDDNCALELHRSKSYIVSLIDRALSKELGTVPGERSRRKFDDMDPKKAAVTVSKHSSTKDLSMEITNALTESIISTATAPQTDEKDNSMGDDNEGNCSKTSSSRACCCSVG